MTDAIVIGAGVAGLRVAGELRRAGYSVIVLEASARMGGRIRTLYDTTAGVPVELGAEFVHGAAKQTNKLLDAAHLGSVEVLGEHYRSRNGRFEEQEKVWKRMARVFKRMDPDRDKDRSFAQFLKEKPGGPLLAEERELARGFVEGFNAADSWRISEKALAQQGDPTEAAAHAARVVNGYGALVAYMSRDVVDVVQCNSVVNRVLWDDGKVEVFTSNGNQYKARCAVITVPLPFLQDDSIAIEPDVPRIRKAARLLVMGDVARVAIVMKQRFWEKLHADLSFVHTPERSFNVWWTLYPLHASLLVAWSGGPKAAQLYRGDVEDAAVHELARTFGMPRARAESHIDSLHHHDWSSDRFTRGAYSYVGVGGVGAARQLSQAVRGTLFFAGEATDEAGGGTVEGAIASGNRAFRQIVKALALA